MIYSMTGYGKHSTSHNGKVIEVEIKSLNSKFLDLKARLPQGFKEKEMVVRKLATEHAIRGKVDLSIEINSEDPAADLIINKDLFKAYYTELQRLGKEVGAPENADWLQATMRIPNIFMPSNEEIDENEWKTVEGAIVSAFEKFMDFRQTEGNILYQDFKLRVQNISDLLKQIEPFEKERIVKVRERFRQNLAELLPDTQVDENRFEQEIIFYLEKYDITEEKVRLAQHCKYYLEQLESQKAKAKGRKLNFITQEMGREINTLGAKANSADIQRLVVMMKDELEKIKEQNANVL
ncbi:MAG: YicC/YloC family endoribonuclease [Bacteroidota bacterium]